MTTLIIGGTFNPIHLGHLYLAEEAASQLGYERVLFIPANIPAHKRDETGISPEQRLTMLRTVLAYTPFQEDDTEIRRGGVSYTIDTVEDLRQRYVITGSPGLVIGDDLVEGLPKWRQWDRLRQMVDLVIAHRTTAERVECRWEHRYLDNIILPISSRDLRERIADGRAYRYLLPPEAYRYIREHGLYGANRSGDRSSGEKGSSA
jgi:nicotinate-nucleotide adenylyltransferase